MRTISEASAISPTLISPLDVVFNATQIDIDPATGRALAIERVQRLWEP